MTSVGSLETQPDPTSINTFSWNPSEILDKFISFFSKENFEWNHLSNYKLLYFIVFGGIIFNTCSLIFYSLSVPYNILISILMLDKLTINCISRRSFGLIIRNLKPKILLFYEKIKKRYQETVIQDNSNQAKNSDNKNAPIFSQSEKALQCEYLYQITIETIYKEASKPQNSVLYSSLGLKKEFKFYPSYNIDYQDDNFIGINIAISNVDKSKIDQSIKFSAEVRVEIKNRHHEGRCWQLNLLSLRIIRLDNWEVFTIKKFG